MTVNMIAYFSYFLERLKRNEKQKTKEENSRSEKPKALNIIAIGASPGGLGGAAGLSCSSIGFGEPAERARYT